jgi:hypothetical protein
MSNPNRTVAAARSRVLSKTVEQQFSTRPEAEAFAQELRDRGETNVRVTSYKFGSFKKPVRAFLVRAYSRG